MPKFEVESYKVSTYLERFAGETRPTRVLEMKGPVLYHGIQNRASFAFSSAFSGVWSDPVVAYLTDGGFAGLSIAGWFPVSEFSYYYDIVRAERPINVFYEFREYGATAGYLRQLGLGTSNERVGEGPSDSTEDISLSLSTSLEALMRNVMPMPTRSSLGEKSGDEG